MDFIFVQMSSSYQTVPNRNSPIVHEVGSHSKTPGIQAIIFIEKPSRVFTNTAVEGNSVYLINTGIGEFFKPFHLIEDKAVVLTVDQYLEFLKFIKDKFPDIEAKMKIKIKLMRKCNVPILLVPQIHFYCDGWCVFQEYFGDAFLQIRKESDKDKKDYMTIQRPHNGVTKTVTLNVTVMQEMAAKYDKLVKILNDAGYIKPESNLDMPQLENGP